MQTALMCRKTASTTAMEVVMDTTTDIPIETSASSCQGGVRRGYKCTSDGGGGRGGETVGGGGGGTAKDAKETIHSGHFMVSDFEAEAQDDEDELAVPVPEEETQSRLLAITAPAHSTLSNFFGEQLSDRSTSQQLSIETSLNKLFQCMSLAYRQKLTSPKWNRFKGIRLRWKDKIRLNNVIWRCWHMQFILKQNTLVCQFASPLDVDTHNKPEAVVLEGKYWKRKLAAVTAEYKKWRMFYRNKILGWSSKDGIEMLQLESVDTLDWCSSADTSGSFTHGSTGNACGTVAGASSGESMMVDEDYMELMTDTLFSTITSNQPIYFPDPREIARGASLADFIQPSLGPLQPNLDDFMDTLEPLQEFLNSKLPPVPEEEDMFRGSSLNANYSDLDLINDLNEENTAKSEETVVEQQQAGNNSMQYTVKIYAQPQTDSVNTYRNNIINTEQNYRPVQSNFEEAVGTERSVGEETGRLMEKSANRVIQQAQQQNPYQQQQPLQQNHAFDRTAQQQQQQHSYPLEIQGVQLTPVQSSVHLGPVNDQDLLNVQQSFPSNNSALSVQQRAIRTQAKPYKIVQPQQSYKFQSVPQNFNTQQCKFSADNFKTHPAQQAVSVTTQQQQQQPVQSQILLQCRPSGLDLTVPTLQSPKLLSQPGAGAADKEEVFAIPKYQMKARNRSRSSSSLVPSTRMNSLPLGSAASDPALHLNNNVLLAQLLTNTASGVCTMNASPDKVVVASNSSSSSSISSNNNSIQSGNSNPSTNVKRILPIPLPATVSPTHVTTTPNNVVQAMQIQTQPPQPQPQPCGQQAAVLLQTSPTNNPPQNSPGSPKDSSNAPSPQALSLSPLHSPMSIGSPLSPGRNYVKTDADRGQYKEQRRVGHIHAEQKRRYNIKNGFDMLHSLIPQLSQNPNTKLSKAAMLQKGADYIRQLRAERNQLKEEMDTLRRQIECLNTSISNCQSMLPATGAPVSRHRTNKMKEMFDEYVRTRTRENWKFWIFSILLEPLMLSFNASVSTASIEDLYRSTILWVEQHCSLVDLRPAVLNSLRYLCTATDILSDPARLPEEALAAVNRTERRRSIQ